ncbi:MAG: type II secretion system protein [Terracidiphilus sp.]
MNRRHVKAGKDERTAPVPPAPLGTGTARRAGEAGFTLLELMVVMAIIAVLAVVAVPKFSAAIRQAREAVLKEDLHVMRAAIDSYTMDKQKAPQSLDDLVQEGYLREIPMDPITHSKESWVTDTSDSLHSLDQSDPGIDNVHSGSQDTGTDGQAYSQW